MVIEDPLDVAHGLLRGRDHHGRIQAVTQQQRSRNSENRESAFHSASKTVSNSKRQAVVKTTSYATSNAIQNAGEVSPVRMAVVAFTIPSSAGIESGNSRSGSMISRARV